VSEGGATKPAAGDSVRDGAASQPAPSPSSSPSSSPPSTKSVGGRGPAYWARWLHFYLSAVGFAGIFFFAVTGLTLNHAETCEAGESVTREFTGKLDPAALKSDRADAARDALGVDRIVVTETLRAAHGLRGLVREFQVDDAECTVLFAGPAYSADVYLNRATGEYRGQETRLTSVALWDDLHKGRYGGEAWSVVIDVCAALTAISAVTGLWLLCYVRRRRAAGLVASVLGAAALFAVYAFGVL
jgi:hypothetical protein